MGETERPSLDKPVQERLGRELRVAYDATEPKPAYLGDPALPPEFDEAVHRLHRAQKAHEAGTAAVERALADIDAIEPAPDGEER